MQPFSMIPVEGRAVSLVLLGLAYVTALDGHSREQRWAAVGEPYQQQLISLLPGNQQAPPPWHPATATFGSPISFWNTPFSKESLADFPLQQIYHTENQPIPPFGVWQSPSSIPGAVQQFNPPYSFMSSTSPMLLPNAQLGPQLTRTSSLPSIPTITYQPSTPYPPLIPQGQVLSVLPSATSHTLPLSPGYSTTWNQQMLNVPENILNRASISEEYSSRDLDVGVATGVESPWFQMPPFSRPPPPLPVRVSQGGSVPSLESSSRDLTVGVFTGEDIPPSRVMFSSSPTLQNSGQPMYQNLPPSLQGYYYQQSPMMLGPNQNQQPMEGVYLPIQGPSYYQTPLSGQASTYQVQHQNQGLQSQIPIPIQVGSPFSRYGQVGNPHAPNAQYIPYSGPQQQGGFNVRRGDEDVQLVMHVPRDGAPGGILVMEMKASLYRPVN